MTHDDVQRWLDRYIEAWQTYDGATIADLFAEDAVYRYVPWGEPVKGRDTIVNDWLNPTPPRGRDEPGTWKARYEPLVVEGDSAVAIGETWYFADASQSEETHHYWNLWPLRFDADGRCTEFTEYFMQRKK